MKDRITVKDLKEFLKDLDEKAPVFVDSYKGQNHYKEFACTFTLVCNIQEL